MDDEEIRFTAPADAVEQFRRTAEMHGRDVREELRLAMLEHVASATLAALQDPAVRNGLLEQGVDPADARVAAIAQLDAVLREAFPGWIPRQPGPGDPRLN